MCKRQLVTFIFLDPFVQKLTVFCFFTPVICFQNWFFFWSIFWIIFGPFLGPSHRAWSIFKNANQGLGQVFRVSILDAFLNFFSDHFWMANPHYKLAILGVENWRVKNGSKKHQKRPKNDNKMGAQKTAKKRRKMDQKNESNKSLLTHA